MPLWDKVRTELDRAGRAAQQAIDEGRDRLDAFRARQLADRAAQALGYALYRARAAGGELDADTYARLSATLASHEAEAARLEERLKAAGARPGAGPGADATEPPAPEAARGGSEAGGPPPL